MAILTLNAGSSSIKFALFDDGAEPARVLEGTVQRIGTGGARMKVTGVAGVAGKVGGGGPAPVLCDGPIAAPTAAAAGEAVLAWLKDYFVRTSRAGGAGGGDAGARAAVNLDVTAIGHRIVHGGTTGPEHQRITGELMERLNKAVPLDPDHLPGEIALIRQCEKHFAGVPQFGCFDTVFHARLPALATMLPIPREYFDAGVRKYGFHGLSYEFLMGELGRIGGAGEAEGRVILAHLGSGASLAAVRGGLPIDTTMAFTPSSGVMMGTRPGDLDAGVIVYLAREEHRTAGELERFINTRCGLLGVSETSSDARDLLAARGTDGRAAEAIGMFCLSVRKAIGALAAALGGVDVLVFAGGIGEHSPEIRAEICKDLEFLGVGIDAGRNERGEGVISTDRQADGARDGGAMKLTGRATVRIVRTDEEMMIARHVRRMTGADA